MCSLLRQQPTTIRPRCINGRRDNLQSGVPMELMERLLGEGIVDRDVVSLKTTSALEIYKSWIVAIVYCADLLAPSVL